MGVIHALSDDGGVVYVNMNNKEDACASIAKALDMLTQDRAADSGSKADSGSDRK